MSKWTLLGVIVLVGLLWVWLLVSLLDGPESPTNGADKPTASSHDDETVEASAGVIDLTELMDEGAERTARAGRNQAVLAQRMHRASYDPFQGVLKKDISKHLQLSRAYFRAGQLSNARVELETATAVAPDDPAIWLSLAAVQEALADLSAAQASYNRVLDLDPANTAAANNLAYILATTALSSLRDGARAVALARMACEITRYQSAATLDTLAAAYAEVGDFESAVATASRAHRLAIEEGTFDLADHLETCLSRYRANKPMRVEPQVAAASASSS
jgi:tetratricopeptide (TPR) repeat protein